MDDALFPHYSEQGRDLIRKAYDVAEKALAGETRSNGTPFFGHPLAVAKIVSDEIGLPPECVAAVFLHEATRGGKVDLDIHALKLDESVYTMVDGLNKISTIKPKDTRLEAENYKKLIIQYSTDPRVTVIKLADRLEVMRSLAIFPKADRERKVLETLMLYIPLAHQLGLYNMKREMEDIYLSYAEPEQYRLITNKLRATQKDREKLMAEFIEPLKVKLSEAGIQYKLKIRTKAAYSIWAKMVKQKVPFEGVFDVFAIRFIIDCPEDIRLERELCWKVFGFVTEEYEQDNQAAPRLGHEPQAQRLRIPPYHGQEQGRRLRGGPDPHSADGRDRGERLRLALVLQGHQAGRDDGPLADVRPLRPRASRHGRPGGPAAAPVPGDLRVHPDGRAPDPARRRDRAGFRLQHPHQYRHALRGR